MINLTHKQISILLTITAYDVLRNNLLFNEGVNRFLHSYKIIYNSSYQEVPLYSISELWYAFNSYQNLVLIFNKMIKNIEK